MSRSLAKKRRQVDALKRRVAAHDPNAWPTCPLPGCGRPTQASAGKGLSLTHCKYHVQFRGRHGSFWKGTYTGTRLRPYRDAVARHLKANLTEDRIRSALRNLETDILFSGPNRRLADLHRMGPEAKAKAAFARLRDKGVPALRVLNAYLAVSAAVRDDPIGPGGEPDEYRLVQIAKTVMRQASGQRSDHGQFGTFERYARSTGMVLRVFGRRVDDACRHLLDTDLEPILEAKRDAQAKRFEAQLMGLAEAAE